jgi:hypothetical protein
VTKDSQTVNGPGQGADSDPLLRVSVLGPGGTHFEPESNVVLSWDGAEIRIPRKRGRLWYEARVKPGSYELRVATLDDGSLEAGPERIVVSADKDVVVHLGKPGWPFYRVGDSVVPYEPPRESNLQLAVIFDGPRPDADTSEALKKILLTPAQNDPDSVEVRAEGGIWVLRGEALADFEGLSAELIGGIDPNAPFAVRVGVPVSLDEHSVSVLTNRFLVRFVQSVGIEHHLASVGGRIIRHELAGTDGLKLIELGGTDFIRHQEIIERWYSESVIDYSEPDIVAEIVEAEFPAVAPNDNDFDLQTSIVDEGVMQAWQYLHAIHKDLTLGSPNVYGAPVDAGTDPEFADCTAALTDGLRQLSACFDFQGKGPCPTDVSELASAHGMQVYGVISLRTNNKYQAAGIAPNCHHIAVRYDKKASWVEYRDMLFWVAGLEPFSELDPAPDWWPAKLEHAADVINCSHTPPNLAKSALVAATFEYLARKGRGGRGTIVVYAAGNLGQEITLAKYAHLTSAHTLAIACTVMSENGEVRWTTNYGAASNYGQAIDICARGTFSQTINLNGTSVPFSATSAAATHVSATVALMLSACPKLGWDEVRDILRETAFKVDPVQTDPAGAYGVDGHSAWYGYGRLDIARAVVKVHVECSNR